MKINNPMRNKIYESDVRYDILKPFVDWCTRRSYKKISVAGLENLPEDGAVLLAPNHCNTLMDALVVLQSTKDAKVFGARADMFKRPLIARIMHFVRILPMVRQRDGLRNVLKNHETFEIIVETLENGVPFIMFPEGRHRPAHSLLPLGKGIMRTAVAANEKFGKEKPVYIVPAGIEYGDYFRYRSTCLVSFGKPINATEFINSLDVENDAQLNEPLRKELVERMSELITYIPDDENLPAKWSLTKVLTAGFSSCNLVEKRDNNKKVIAQIEDAIQANPKKMTEILANAAAFDKTRRKAGISFKSLGKKNLGLRCLGKALLAVLGLPYYAFSAIASLPMWVLSTFLRGKIRDKAFGNTVSFGVKLGLGAIWYPIVFALAFIFAPWQYALAGSLLAIPTYNYMYDFTEFLRVFASDCRLACNKGIRKSFDSVRESFKNLK